MSVWIEADGLHWRRWTVVKPEQVQTKGEREKIRLQNKNLPLQPIHFKGCNFYFESE